VFSWQVTGIGGYILFFGWSNLYRYDAETGAITPLAPVVPEVSAPCWTDLTLDGAFAVGACGEFVGVIERNKRPAPKRGSPPSPSKARQGRAPMRLRGVDWPMASPAAIPTTRRASWSWFRREARDPRPSPPMHPAPSM
jgi:hypothetical protein